MFTNSDRKQRVKNFGTAAAGCACENHKANRLSPASVEDGETLARFIFHPMHRGGTSAFSQVSTDGCSIQRERMAGDAEIRDFICDFLRRRRAEGKQVKWVGVRLANCASVRNIRLDEMPARVICVYDTAEPTNRAHAEMFQTVDEPWNDNQVRVELKKLFGNDITPHQYRNGVLADLDA